MDGDEAACKGFTSDGESTLLSALAVPFIEVLQDQS
jgi:hypothetical protein